MKAETTAKRLKSLREKANLSHAKLKIALGEKYNINISEASLKKYEISDKYHSNYGDVKGMKIEYLDMFADFYNVPSDYLLGATNSKNKDINIRQITDITGLSTEAIQILKELKSMKQEQINELYAEINPTFIFDCMLSDMSFTSIFSFHILRYCKVKYKQSTEMTLNKNLNTDKQYDLLRKSVNENMERYFAINQIERFIDDIYDTYIKMQEYKQNI